MERKDLTGNKYGKLTVTEMIYGQYAGSSIRTQCKCRCDCGNEITTVSDRLISGKKISCGCDTIERRSLSNRKDLTGQRFGRLVVKKMLWDFRPTKCECICDCGTIVTVIGTGLTSGKTNSCGCYQKDRTSESNTKDWTDAISSYGIRFIKQSRKTETGQWLWICECGICGTTFEALPARIMSGHTTSCGCAIMSNGEIFIKEYLEQRHISFVSQYSFDDCKNKYILKFDFAIFNNDRLYMLIEYDGKQHYSPINYFGGEEGFMRTQARDQIKNEYCHQHGYPLLRIPYTLSLSEIKNELDLYLSVETTVSA